MKISRIVLYTVQAVVGCLVLFSLYYILFAAFFSTDNEKRLEEENDRYRRALPEIEFDVALLNEEIRYLRSRDAGIYGTIFKTGTPSVFAYPDHEGIADVMESASRIEENWKEIYDILNTPGFSVPPVFAPIGNLEYTNIGASVGEKMNPFYKMPVHHDGVDIVAPPLTAVRASAPGIVSSVKNVTGGDGTVVEIVHAGGYVSRYAHLHKAMVGPRSRVGTGDVIGLVGDSGRSFTTHLHYELTKDGQLLDPVYWFFDSTDPTSYYNMLVMSTISRQSMD